MSQRGKRAPGKKKASGKPARARSAQRRKRKAEPAEAVSTERKWDSPVESSADRVAREDQVFPADLADASEPPGGKITLPASGLADEILSRADAAAVEATAPPEAESSQEIAPVASEPAVRSHNISFLGLRGIVWVNPRVRKGSRLLWERVRGGWPGRENRAYSADASKATSASAPSRVPLPRVSAGPHGAGSLW